MKAKLLGLFTFSILIVVLLVGVASADLTIGTITAPASVAHNAGSFTVTFDLTNNGPATGITWAFDDNLGVNVTSISSNVNNNIADGTTAITVPVTLTINFPAYQSGNFNLEIIATPAPGENSDTSLPIMTNIPQSDSLLIKDLTIPNGQSTGTLVVNNTGNTILNNIQLTLSGSAFTASLNPSASFSLNAGATKPITVTITSNLDDLDFGSNSITVSATATELTNAVTGKISTEGEYCDSKNLGNLKTEINSFEVVEGFGEDEEFFPFDEVEVEIEVSNDGDEDVNDIEVKWGLYDQKTGKFIIDGKESKFDLKDGDEETITINFVLDENIDDLKDADLIFIAKATGEDEKFDSDKTCTSDLIDVELVDENDFVIVGNIKIPESVSCGSSIHVTGEVWNIGSDGQDDVSLRIFVEELDINKIVTIGDIDSFEGEDFDALIEIPKNAEEKTYHLGIWVLNEDEEVYENDFDDEDAIYDLPLVVKGGCSAGGNEGNENVIITAILESGGDAGKELVIKSTISNTGDELGTFRINAAGFTDWASAVEIEPTTFALGAGDSEEVLLSFDVKKDASGDQLFNIEVTDGDNNVVSQPVSVSITGKTGFNFLGRGNTYLWLIGALNVLLVIIIIIVAVRVAKK